MEGVMNFIPEIIVIVLGALIAFRQYIVEKRRHDYAEFLTAVTTYLMKQESNRKSDQNSTSNNNEINIEFKPGNYANICHRFNLVSLIAPENTLSAVEEMMTLLKNCEKQLNSAEEKCRHQDNNLWDKLTHIRRLFREDLSFLRCIK